MAHKGGKTQPVDTDGTPLLSKYNPADFIVAPSDSKGVSYRMTFRVPPDMEKAIDQIIASNRFPFNTRGDVLRWVTLQGIKMLELMEPVTSVTKRIDILTTILNEESSHAEFMAIFAHLEDSVGKYMSDHAPEQAGRVVAMAKHQFESMPEGHWRERYLVELGHRFGYILNKEGVQLMMGGGNGTP